MEDNEPYWTVSHLNGKWYSVKMEWTRHGSYEATVSFEWPDHVIATNMAASTAEREGLEYR